MFNIPISNGELLDKYAILKIKTEKINDNSKIEKINKELEYLKEFVDKIFSKYDINNLYVSLKNINLKLWNIEDNIRRKEKLNEFDLEFINIARSVYKNNDIRAKIKKQINRLTFSELEEVKSYEDY